MTKPTILAIDTATGACSAAVLARGALAARRQAIMERGHAEALIPMVEAVMAEAGLAYAALDAVAVTVGPGAFTGVRIGLSAARGIGLAAGIPVVGATTLEALARGVPLAERAGATVVAAIESKRADLYVQSFDAACAPAGAPAAMLPEALAEALAGALAEGPLVLAGDGAARAYEALGEAPGRADRVTLASSARHPDPGVLAALAAERLAAAGAAGMALQPATPLYLRPPDAKVPASGGRLRP